MKNSVFTIWGVLTDIEEAPTLSMTFNNQYLTGTYNIIDLRWYAPYKQYGDAVIVCFAYLCFIWRIFTRLSSIIKGVDSGADPFIGFSHAEDYEHGKHSIKGGHSK